jgi:DNA-binding IclR family transcriptional regulator
VQVVHRTAAILLALRGEADGLSLAQIAKRVGLARSTVHRLVAALEQERFVVAASSSRGFRLGPALASLAIAAVRDVVLLIHPYLVQLSQELDETVDLAVLEHDHVLFVDQVAATRRLRAVSSVGAVFPVHCTANGKALLAARTNDEVERLLPAKLERMTPNTIVSRAALIDELERIRVDRVAYDREEHTAGICAVGTVVATAEGPLAAVTVPLPTQRFDGNEKALTAALLRTRTAIEAGLGGG